MAKIFSLGLIFLIITGCFAKPKTIRETIYQTEYRDVYIPTKCDVMIPDRPNYVEGESFPSLVNRILKNYDELENAVRYCKGEIDE